MTAIQRLLHLHHEGTLTDGELLSRLVSLATSREEAMLIVRTLSPELRERVLSYAASLAQPTTLVGFSSGAGEHAVPESFTRSAELVLSAAKSVSSASLRDARKSVYSHSVLASSNG